MAFDSFRGFIRALENADELTHVPQPLGTELEITALADWEMKKPGGGKGLLKYSVVVDEDVDVQNSSEVLFRLCASTDPERDSIFT